MDTATLMDSELKHAAAPAIVSAFPQDHPIPVSNRKNLSKRV